MSSAREPVGPGRRHTVPPKTLRSIRTRVQIVTILPRRSRFRDVGRGAAPARPQVADGFTDRETPLRRGWGIAHDACMKGTGEPAWAALMASTGVAP